MSAVAAPAPDDGLPPIVSIDELIRTSEPELVGCGFAFIPCSACGGETAEPEELERVKANQPHWWGPDRCQCEFDYMAWRRYVAEVEERWDKQKQERGK
jgi:hypothetical protein